MKSKKRKKKKFLKSSVRRFLPAPRNSALLTPQISPLQYISRSLAFAVLLSFALSNHPQRLATNNFSTS